MTGRSSAVGVWTGSEFIVWGGSGTPPTGTTTATTDSRAGAAYDPSTDTWRRIAGAPLDPRLAPAAVWTGQEMLVWGGLPVANAVDPSNEAAAYRPATDSWRRLPDAPVAGYEATWTGTELIVLGADGDIAAYDPRADTWRSLPAAPAVGYTRSLVWTGTELLMFVAPNGVDTAVTGFRLGPDDSSWRPTAPSNHWALEASRMVWTGTEAVAVGQYPARSASGLVGSVAYDPVTDTWREIGSCQIGNHVVWTGQLILGETAGFDPASGGCQPLPPAPERPVGGTTGREASAFAWAGQELLIWSGGNGSDYLFTDGDGVALRPARD
jgi:hypothetical protein